MRENGGDFSFAIPDHLLDERYEFRVKVKLHGAHGPGSAALHEIKIDGICQLNMYSLPFLAPGANRVTVQAVSIPASTALNVTWRWREQGWDRQHTETVRRVPASYVVQVAGDEYPRMKAVIMEAVPD
ncbi:MAG: hypothetical protein FVQ81_11170 [Candidatus Glassbacteria bacterium]|nr:hypothetical protein [Candidatus Glassbacteria bacterium]